MDASGQNSATVPYIGSKISLISNVDIRYEGILYSINTFESTVALQNVRSFGTEGRRQPDIPPSNKTYQFIIFKGKDIKDLTVCEPAAGRIPDDPAVVSVNVPPSTPSSSLMHGSQNQMQSPPLAGQRGGVMNQGDVGGPQSVYSGNRGVYGMGGPGGRMGDFGPQGGHQGPRMPGYPQQQGGGPSGSMPMIRPPQGGGAFGFGSGRGGGDMYQPRGQRRSFMSGDVEGMMVGGGGMGGRGGGGSGRFGGVGRGGGMGRGGGGRRIVGELPPQPNQAMKKEVSQAFDFESSNAKFDKSEAKVDATTTKTTENGENTTNATTSTTTEKTTRGGYNKATSFFDNISCETLDRASGQETRVDRDKQRQLDCETFGPAAAAPRGRSYRRGYRRGGGARRRGGPGAGAEYGGYGRAPAARYVPVNYMATAGGGYGSMMRY